MKNQYVKLLLMALLFLIICGCVQTLLKHEIEMLEALEHGDIGRVERLLDQGTDVNITMMSKTPLMLASMEGHTSIAKLLLDRGAEVNAKSNNGGTALMLASAQGHADIVKLLLSNRADVNAQTDDGNTPLLYAVHYEHSDIIELLKAAGANEEALNR